MARQSFLLQQIEALSEQRANQKLGAAQLIVMQYAVDTLQIAIHQTEGWGYDRIKRLTKAWDEVKNEYKAAINPQDPEADVMQEHMDRVFAQIIRNKQDLVPFNERYPELKKVKYGKR